MRCPTCGMENAPDSRFCGGCGARLTPPKQKLAPTHKILDDAPYPSQPPPSTQPSKRPVSFAPPSMPPQSSSAETSNQRPITASRAPTAPSPGTPPSGQRTPLPAIASGSVSIPPRRPVGLITVLLLIDLGLAVTGAVLLVKGLAKPEAARSIEPAKSAPAQKTEAPAPPPAPPPPVEAVEAKGSAAARKEERRPKEKAKPASPATKPAQHDVAAEVDRHSARSKALFDHCADRAGSVHGQIQIVFEIQPDGSVTHAGAAENTTGSEELARCLAGEIATWKLSAHQGPTSQFVKSFIYP